MNDEVPTPEGIEKRHIHEAGGSRLQRWPIGLVGLGVLLGASLLGLFGTETELMAAGSDVEVTVDGPSRIRNGEFFELRINVSTDRDIGDLVVAVDEDVWRDITVNTLIPAAAEEGFTDGAFTFAFGPVEARTRFSMKVDAQINPDHSPSTNRGAIAVSDGEEPLAAVDYVMEVLP